MSSEVITLRQASVELGVNSRYLLGVALARRIKIRRVGRMWFLERKDLIHLRREIDRQEVLVNAAASPI